MVPVSDCPLSREKMAAAAAIDTEGHLFSRHPSRRRGERERGPSVPKQGNFRGGGERWGRRVARTTISVAVAAATATAIVVYIPPTTGIERRSRWQ